MRVLRLCWLGIASREPKPTIRFFRDTLGLAVEFEEPTTSELSLPSGDHVQIFAPENRYFSFFSEHANGPVPLFEVDDIRRAGAEFAAARIELIGEIEHDDAWEWLHVRGPDGNLYGLASRRQNEAE